MNCFGGVNKFLCEYVKFIWNILGGEILLLEA